VDKAAADKGEAGGYKAAAVRCEFASSSTGGCKEEEGADKGSSRRWFVLLLPEMQ
jgi:hypothetical protein